MFRALIAIAALLSLLSGGCVSSIPLTEIDCSRFPEAIDHNDSFPPDKSVTIDSAEAERMLIHKEYPQYPELAIRAGLEGTVVVRLWIGRDGSVRKAFILKSSAEIFNEPTLKAAEKLLFRPAACDGTAISVWATMPIRFKLTDH